MTPPRRSAHLLVTTFLAGAGPAALLAPSSPGRAAVAVGIATLTTALIALGSPGRPRVLATIVASGAATAMLGSPWAGAWLAAGLFVGIWVTAEAPPFRALPSAGPGAMAPAVVLMGTAAFAAYRSLPTWQVLIPLTLALLVPVLARLGGGRMHRVAELFGTAAGNAASTALFTGLGVIMLLPSTMLSWIGAVRELGGAPGWVQRTRYRTDTSKMWQPERRTKSANPAADRRRRALGVVVLVGIGSLVPSVREGVTNLFDTRPEERGFRLERPPLQARGDTKPVDPIPADLEEDWLEPGEPQAAHLGDPWFNGEYSQQHGWLLQTNVGWRHENVYRFLDVRTTYVNVQNGRRVSWSPPDDGRPRLTLWMFGGSTTWGLDQRDEHTIASEVARVAYEHGIVIDVHNRGLTGHLHWMEAERFAWDLTSEPKPDLVFFYDGVNDVWANHSFDAPFTRDVKPMFDPTLNDIWARTHPDSVVPPSESRGKVLGLREYPLPHLLGLSDSEGMGARTMERYDRSRELSKATAGTYSIPVRYFWQPNRYTRPLNLDEPHSDYENERLSRIAENEMITYLPEDVVDLSDVLDEVEAPLYTDDVHHNELGARVIAESIFDELEPQLRSLYAKVEPS